MHNLTGTEKAAVLLLAVGEEAAGAILAGMPRAEAAKVVVALSQLGRVDAAVADAVLREFNDTMAAGSKGPKPLVGDAASAKRLLKAARPHDAAAIDRELDLASPTLSETLAALPAPELARFLQNEHPQTVALVLAHLAPAHCGQVFKDLPQALRSEAIIRIARLTAVDPQVLADLEDAIRAGVGSSRRLAAQKKGGAKPVAALLAGLAESERDAELHRLEERDPALADEVRALLFVFEDIAGLDDRGVQEILKAAAEATLKLALKGASDGLKARLFANMSQRRAQALAEDLAATAKVRRSDVEAAQKELAALARRLMEDGKVLDPRSAA